MQWAFITNDGTIYDSITEVINAIAAEFGEPEFNDKEVEVEETVKNTQWGFVDEDGTKYDKITDLIDAIATKNGVPGDLTDK